MKIFYALCTLLSVAAVGGQTFKKAEYVKRDEDKKARHVIGTLTFDPTNKTMRFDGVPWWPKKGAPPFALELKNTAISSILYERTSKPRYAEALFIAWPLIFTREKQHYITIQYNEVNGPGRYAIFQLDKKNYREILAAMQATLGIIPTRTEER